MKDLDPRLQRAFVATRFLLGERGDACDNVEMGQEARAVWAALASPSQESRVATLAREITRIALALTEGNLR